MVNPFDMEMDTEAGSPATDGAHSRSAYLIKEINIYDTRYFFREWWSYLKIKWGTRALRSIRSVVLPISNSRILE
jgi:hypothetical protein|tara:strand:- start:124 stop:348 length:225 start_codon:yes stop_codon:yes gene_type:complete